MTAPSKPPHRVHLIGSASAAGASDPGTATGPETVQTFGPGESGPTWDWQRIVSDPGEGNPEARIAQLCGELATSTEAAVAAGERFVVVGGDHACAIGTWSGAFKALQSRGPLGLVWIDAHMDAHTPATSPSGNIHGMPVAALLGFGARSLREIALPHVKLQPEHLTLIGIRSYESGEAGLLEELGVRIYYMEEIHQRGLATVIAEALATVKRDTAGFGVSIDLDAVCPEDAPGVGTPAAGGLGGRELVTALTGVGDDPAFIGAEVAEFNPARDREQRTLRLTRDLINALIGTT